MKHPIQPVYTDSYGIKRFKENKIVKLLLDSGKFDMESLALMGFSDEDRSQFAQLVGFSLEGYSQQTYVDDDTYAICMDVAESGVGQTVATNSYLENKLSEVRQLMKPVVTSLFRIHEDDIHS